MFRVKKDDYNTVQFIPEYRSTNKSRNSTMQDHTKKMYGFVPVLLVVIAVLLVAGICVGGWMLYGKYFGTDDQFEQMFADGDWSACETLMSENGDDDGFMEAITPTVQAALDQVKADFDDGKISASDAAALLEEYDQATCGRFTDQIDAVSSYINNIGTVKAGLDEIRTLCEANSITDAYDAITALTTKADGYGIGIDSDLEKIVKEYDSAFKYTFFSKAVTAVNNKDYDEIKTQLSTVNSYLDDEDITAVLEEIGKAEAGTVTKTQAKKFIQAAADAAAAEMKGETAEDTTAAKTDTSSKSDTSSKDDTSDAAKSDSKTSTASKTTASTAAKSTTASTTSKSTSSTASKTTASTSTSSKTSSSTAAKTTTSTTAQKTTSSTTAASGTTSTQKTETSTAAKTETSTAAKTDTSSESTASGTDTAA